MSQTQLLAGMLSIVAGVAPVMGTPYAVQVIDYYQGTGLSGSEASFNDPATTLGLPSRHTPHDVFPSVVSVFSPPFLSSQLVSLGDGGYLTVQLGTPAINDPANPYGVDLIIFGNAGFRIDFATLSTGDPAMLFGDGNGKVEVSADGISFFEVPGSLVDQLYPTQGYTDTGPFDALPGQNPTDFFRPVNPAFTLADFSAKSYSQILAMYDGSGGGLPIDIEAAVDAQGQPAGLTSISYVRVSHAGLGGTQVDAFVVVPEPAAAFLLAFGAAFIRPRSSRSH
jgi:hypothetical protein